MKVPFPIPRHGGFIARFSLAAIAVCCSLAFAGSICAAGAAGPTIVQCNSIDSAILHRPVGYCIDLPADYASSTSKRYPALYFLHGLFENEHHWVERGGKDIFDQLSAQGEIGPFLVVMPNGGETFYINSEDGQDRYEDFFIQEFIPYIDQHYRTIASRASRGISGVSMGGYGALHLAMRHPDVFSLVTAHSAVLVPQFPNPMPTEGRWGFYARILQHTFGSPLNEAYWDKNNPLTLARNPESFKGLKIYFDCGDQDRYGFENGAAMLDAILTKENYPHEYTLRPGDHGWSFLNKYMKFSLLFEWQSFQKAGQTSAAATQSGAH